VLTLWFSQMSLEVVGRGTPRDSDIIILLIPSLHFHRRKRKPVEAEAALFVMIGRPNCPGRCSTQIGEAVEECGQLALLRPVQSSRYKSKCDPKKNLQNAVSEAQQSEGLNARQKDHEEKRESGKGKAANRKPERCRSRDHVVRHHGFLLN
jgi:hypothetical protein